MEVSLSKFVGEVTRRMVITRSQAIEYQTLLKSAMLRPHIQQRLDELEQQAAGNDVKYRAHLRRLLNYEVLPELVSHFGLVNDDRGPQLLHYALGAHLGDDLEIHENWLELEILQRNKPMEALASARVQQLRSLVAVSASSAD